MSKKHFLTVWILLNLLSISFGGDLKQAQNGDMPEAEAIEMAKKSYQKALDKNPDSPDKNYIKNWLEQH